jgi:uncharacterized membrane protein HdeD (DUF308 family)
MQTAREMPGSLPDRPMLHALAKCWWLLLLRGLAAIVFGVLAFLWPGLTLVTLVLLYGAFALVDGVLSLVAAFTGSTKPVPTWWLVVVGLLGIAAGAVTFLWPGITAILLVLFIGAWTLVHGIFEIIGAIQLRKEIDNEWMLILGGVLSVIFARLFSLPRGPGRLAWSGPSPPIQSCLASRSSHLPCDCGSTVTVPLLPRPHDDLSVARGAYEPLHQTRYAFIRLNDRTRLCRSVWSL